MNFRAIFLVSDYDDPNPVNRQNVALAHMLVGVVGFAVFGAVWPVALAYIAKEVAFDLRGKRNLRILADSAVDFLMVLSGAIGAARLGGWESVGLLLAMIAVTFTYYAGRQWK